MTCRTYPLLRRDNVLVLSEDLVEGELQSLALGDLFPELHEEWLSIKRYIHEIFLLERTKKESAVASEIDKARGSLQGALREEVVGHVIRIFPYVLFSTVRTLTACRSCLRDTGRWIAMISLPLSLPL